MKILDSWGLGKAIVSTSIGCEGLEAHDGINVMIRDDPRSFAAAVLALIRDAKLRRRLEEQGRRTVEQSYGWGSIGNRVRTLYKDLLAEPRSIR